MLRVLTSVALSKLLRLCALKDTANNTVSLYKESASNEADFFIPLYYPISKIDKTKSNPCMLLSGCFLYFRVMKISKYAYS